MRRPAAPILLRKHMGPGPHPDGSPQSVHGRLGNRTLADKVESSGGFTYSPVGNKSPKSGYAMALNPMYEERVPLRDFGPDHVAEYRKKWAAVLAEPNNYLGAWVQDGYVYLDVSVVVSDESEAMDVARQNQQRAIFNLSTFEEIEVMGLDEIERFR